MAEQRYQAVLAVISDGETVTDVAARFGVTRKTVHDWLAWYEAGGLEKLGDRCTGPVVCAQDGKRCGGRDRADADLASWWGPRRIAFELAKSEDDGQAEAFRSRGFIGRWCGCT